MSNYPDNFDGEKLDAFLASWTEEDFAKIYKENLHGHLKIYIRAYNERHNLEVLKPAFDFAMECIADTVSDMYDNFVPKRITHGSQGAEVAL